MPVLALADSRIPYPQPAQPHGSAGFLCPRKVPESGFGIQGTPLQYTMKQLLQINIGLFHGFPSATHSPVTVLSTLASHGFLTLRHALAESVDGEPTVSAIVNPPEDWSGAIYLVSCALNQTAVAVSADEGRTGWLIGPGAKSWGAFDPARFVAL